MISAKSLVVTSERFALGPHLDCPPPTDLSYQQSPFFYFMLWQILALDVRIDRGGKKECVISASIESCLSGELWSLLASKVASIRWSSVSRGPRPNLRHGLIHML